MKRVDFEKINMAEDAAYTKIHQLLNDIEIEHQLNKLESVELRERLSETFRFWKRQEDQKCS